MEIQIYKGANGTFVLYEDEFDNYNYENGANPEITFDWKDSSQSLTIAKCNGSYYSMLQQRYFNLLVIEPEETNQSRQVAHNGNKVTVKL